MCAFAQSNPFQDALDQPVTEEDSTKIEPAGPDTDQPEEPEPEPESKDPKGDQIRESDDKVAEDKQNEGPDPQEDEVRSLNLFVKETIDPSCEQSSIDL